MSFGVEGLRNVLVDIETYADTKVRRFGDVYRVDKQVSPATKPPPDLRTLLPRMSKRRSEKRGKEIYSFGTLFLGHFTKERELHSFLAPVTAPEFLLRYGMLHRGDCWHDVHGRDFFSTIQIWYVEQQPKANSR